MESSPTLIEASSSIDQATLSSGPTRSTSSSTFSPTTSLQPAFPTSSRDTSSLFSSAGSLLATITLTTTLPATSPPVLTPITLTTTGPSSAAPLLVSLPPYGLTYNAYINPFNIDNDPTWRDDFASMGPSYFNTNNNTLVTCGIALDIRFGNDDVYTSINGYLPNSSVLTDLEHIAVVFHGYFVPPGPGSYSFTAASDDWGYVYFGSPIAETTWGEDNWAASNRAGGPSVNGAVVIGEGERVPMTFLYANAGQRCTCDFSVTFPNGTVVEDFTGLFVQPMVGDGWVPAVLNVSTCPPPLAYTDSGDDVDS